MIQTMATININAGTNDVININVVTLPKTEVSKKDLFNKLNKDLVNKSNNLKKHLWYEVFYDFADDFDEKIYPIIKDMPYETAFTYCWGLLRDYDAYYDSDQYIKDLNGMLKKC